MTILAKEMLVKNMYQNPNKQKTANVSWNYKFLFIGDFNLLIFVLENILAVDDSLSNYIFDISTLDKKSQDLIKEKLITFGKLLIKNNCSFAIVSNYLNMIDFNIVPTVEEAYDIIELEEIERDLLKN